jgi:Transmembrane secretion effector
LSRIEIANYKSRQNKQHARHKAHSPARDLSYINAKRAGRYRPGRFYRSTYRYFARSAYARLPLTRPKNSESESGPRVRFRTSFETIKTQFTGQEKAQIIPEITATPRKTDLSIMFSFQAMIKSATSSSWTALRNRGFRMIWLASVISGTCAAAHGMAATWTVNELSHSTLLLSLMSTFSSLPFFLFALPAGALADMVDRAKLVRITHIWLAASAAGLAILGWLHLLNGYLILLFVSLIGAGFAFNAPAFSSLLTDIVSDEELPSASVLSGLQLDISGMIGPALGGALIPLIGTNTIFAANGACFLLINLALLRWRQPKGQLHSAIENFFQSFATAVHYVRYAPGMQVILARQVLFSLLVAAIPALLPVIGLKNCILMRQNSDFYTPSWASAQ